MLTGNRQPPAFRQKSAKFSLIAETKVGPQTVRKPQLHLQILGISLNYVRFGCNWAPTDLANWANYQLPNDLSQELKPGLKMSLSSKLTPFIPG